MGVTWCAKSGSKKVPGVCLALSVPNTAERMSGNEATADATKGVHPEEQMQEDQSPSDSKEVRVCTGTNCFGMACRRVRYFVRVVSRSLLPVMFAKTCLASLYACV